MQNKVPDTTLWLCKEHLRPAGCLRLDMNHLAIIFYDSLRSSKGANDGSILGGLVRWWTYKIKMPSFVFLMSQKASFVSTLIVEINVQYIIIAWVFLEAYIKLTFLSRQDHSSPSSFSLARDRRCVTIICCDMA